MPSWALEGTIAIGSKRNSTDSSSSSSGAAAGGGPAGGQLNEFHPSAGAMRAHHEQAPPRLSSSETSLGGDGGGAGGGAGGGGAGGGAGLERGGSRRISTGHEKAKHLLSPLIEWETLPPMSPGGRLRSSLSSSYRSSEGSMQDHKRGSFCESRRGSSVAAAAGRRGSISSVGSLQSRESTCTDMVIGMGSTALRSSSSGKPPSTEGGDDGGRCCTRIVRDVGNRTLSLMKAFVMSRAFSTSMFLLSFYVLFGDDLRLAFFSKHADDVFNGITIFSIALFSFELVITSIAADDYFLSFFFFLDVISTVSLILDLTFVWESIIGHDSIQPQTSSAGENVSDQSEYARAGRSSRVGTRVARILRVFRLIRMARMVKMVSRHQQASELKHLRKQHSLKSSEMRSTARRLRGKPEEAKPGQALRDDAMTSGEESRVGKKLSDRTTLWVIVLVLAMLVIMPLLDAGGEDGMMVSSAQYGSDVLEQAWRDHLANGSGDSRREWETQVLLYTYYHNYYATCPDVQGSQSCASESISKLCFLGYVTSSASGNYPRDSYVQDLMPNSTNWDVLFTHRRRDWTQNDYVLGEIPEDIKWRLARPWDTECKVYDVTVYGVSLMREEPCPWRRFRPQETVRYFPAVRQNQDASNGALLLLFDVSERSRWEAVLSIFRTVFIIIALALGALLFSQDADNLVLHPIERMINQVELIRKNPLYAIKLGDEQNVKQTLEESYRKRTTLNRIGAFFVAAMAGSRYSRLSDKRKPRRRSHSSSGVLEEGKKQVSLETKILENTIIKLGSLLALGFGEAGTEIIGHNLDDNSGGVDALIPGRKVEAIYGFCQIKDFNITTEVLQERTMVFVNQVAEIVHRIVDEHLGAANKNVGEAFLLVWRVGLYEEELRSKIADLSVASFIQVMSAVSRDQQLAEYGSHPALLAKCSSYRVSLGFGLHLGWAIEGAIGSEFKVEASYLSSHVNMAMCLENFTKYFNVVMLLTEALVRACSKSFAYYFRAIDNVMLKGSKTPTRIFTVDLDCNSVPIETEEKRRKRGYKYRDRQQREGLKLEKLDAEYQVHELFSTDKHIKRMRAAYTLEFCQEFEQGFVNYEAGEWDVAAGIFEATAEMLKGIEDGPSKALLEYMRSFQFKAPPRWPGYRTLVDTHTEDTVPRVPSLSVIPAPTG